jgi:lipoprotein
LTQLIKIIIKKTKNMKNLFFLCIMMLTMTSCATIIETGDNSVRALRQVERFVNAAGPVTSRIDRNSGALVNKSSRTTYTYSVQLGTLRLQNNGRYIDVFQYDGEGWIAYDRVDKTRYGDKKSYNAVTNRKMQKVVVDVTGNGAFVRIYQGHLIVGRHTF